jgi:hypothetical protein
MTRLLLNVGHFGQQISQDLTRIKPEPPRLTDKASGDISVCLVHGPVFKFYVSIILAERECAGLQLTTIYFFHQFVGYPVRISRESGF